MDTNQSLPFLTFCSSSRPSIAAPDPIVVAAGPPSRSSIAFASEGHDRCANVNKVWKGKTSRVSHIDLRQRMFSTTRLAVCIHVIQPLDKLCLWHWQFPNDSWLLQLCRASVSLPTPQCPQSSPTDSRVRGYWFLEELYRLIWIRGLNAHGEPGGIWQLPQALWATWIIDNTVHHGFLGVYRLSDHQSIITVLSYLADEINVSAEECKVQVFLQEVLWILPVCMSCSCFCLSSVSIIFSLSWFHSSDT